MRKLIILIKIGGLEPNYWQNYMVQYCAVGAHSLWTTLSLMLNFDDRGSRAEKL